MRVQQRVGERRFLPEVGRLAQQVASGCPGGSAPSATTSRGSFVRRADAEPLAELLQHVDAGPPIGRVHHEVHRAVGLEHVAQRAQPRIRIGEMVQHAGADDLVERLPELADALDRELMDLEVGEVVRA